MRRPRAAHRARSELLYQPAVVIRPQTLLLLGPAVRVPDHAAILCVQLSHEVPSRADFLSVRKAPLATNGALQVDVPEAEPITVRIKQIQLEQVRIFHITSGSVARVKSTQFFPLSTPRTRPSLHSMHAPRLRVSTSTAQAPASWRSCPSRILGEMKILINSVSRCSCSTTSRDRSPEEAGVYVRTLQAMLRAMGASDGNMEQVCISAYIRPHGDVRWP